MTIPTKHKSPGHQVTLPLHIHHSIYTLYTLHIHSIYYSTPLTGHASTSFAAMLYCVFFLRFMAGQSKGLYWSNRGLFCCFPMILAIWISVTRYCTNLYYLLPFLCHVVPSYLSAYFSFFPSFLFWPNWYRLLGVFIPSCLRVSFRIQDYRHHEDDILAGSIIGTFLYPYHPYPIEELHVTRSLHTLTQPNIHSILLGKVHWSLVLSGRI